MDAKLTSVMDTETAISTGTTSLALRHDRREGDTVGHAKRVVSR